MRFGAKAHLKSTRFVGVAICEEGESRTVTLEQGIAGRRHQEKPGDAFLRELYTYLSC